jgi:mono/diheme cytochrome c family protein
MTALLARRGGFSIGSAQSARKRAPWSATSGRIFAARRLLFAPLGPSEARVKESDMGSIRYALLALPVAAALMAAPARGEVDKKSERTWKAKCSACHGVDGRGDTEQGKKLGIKDYSTAEWQASKTDDAIKAGIENGVPDMDGYKGKLDDEQIKKLVELIRGLKK